MVIEIDGDSHFHDESVVKDLKRQLVLEKMGLCFLRFLDKDVKKSMPSILQEIGGFINEWEDENGFLRTNF